MLFDDTYIEESNINRKPFIWSEDNIIMKFGHKKFGDFVFGQSIQQRPEN